jgi:hypothetical protein
MWAQENPEQWCGNQLAYFHSLWRVSLLGERLGVDSFRPLWPCWTFDRLLPPGALVPLYFRRETRGGNQAHLEAACRDAHSSDRHMEVTFVVSIG